VKQAAVRIVLRCALIGALFFSFGTAGRADTAPVVATDSGEVRGIEGFATQAFLGIPFAAPPVGERRWEAPAPVRRWSGVRDATHLAQPCAAQISGDGPRIANEDCLYLNLYRPNDAMPGEALPVMVFLHGGGNFSGSTRIYDGVRMAEVGHAIVVIAAYRLGIFGSLALPELGRSSGTFMLEDHLAALHWVQRNIAAFGGDPHDVTLSGQSSGGTDVCNLIAAPAAAGLFRQAIVQSGLCSGGTFEGPSLPVAEKKGADVARGLGCMGTHVVACLRSKSTGALLDAWKGPSGSAYGSPLLPISAPVAFATGAFNRVPVLIGFTRDEWWSFEHALYPLSEDGYRKQLAATFRDRAAHVAALYPTANYPHREYALGAAVGDSLIICPALKTAATLSHVTSVSVYQFADRTVPPWKSLGIAQTRPPGYDPGAGHTADLEYLLNYQAAEGPLDATQRRLGDRMIEYWVGFNRAQPSLWPTFHADAPSALEFGAHGESIAPNPTVGAEHHCGFWNGAS
jgi:para-nitrobenzyl esterase